MRAHAPEEAPFGICVRRAKGEWTMEWRKAGGTGAVVARRLDHGGGDSHLIVQVRAGVTLAVGCGKVAFKHI